MVISPFSKCFIPNLRVQLSHRRTKPFILLLVVLFVSYFQPALNLVEEMVENVGWRTPSFSRAFSSSLAERGSRCWRGLVTNIPRTCHVFSPKETEKAFIHYLHNPIVHLFYPPKVSHNHCFHVLLGHEDVLREIKNNAYANFWGLKRCIMRFVQVVN